MFSVVSKIVQQYSVNEEQAVKLIEYHGIIRRELNKQGQLAAVVDSVKLKDGVAAEVSGATKEVLGAVFPGIGSLVGYGIDRTVKGVERSLKDCRPR